MTASPRTKPGAARGGSYAGMGYARCPLCWRNARKSAAQIASGDVKCKDPQRCLLRRNKAVALRGDRP